MFLFSFWKFIFRSTFRIRRLRFSWAIWVMGWWWGWWWWVMPFLLSLSLGTSSLQLNICTSANGSLAASVFWFFLYNFLTIFPLTISLIVIDLCKRSHFLILLITIFRYNMIYGKHCNYTNLGIKIQIWASGGNVKHTFFKKKTS